MTISKKTIRSIHFLNDRVIVDYGAPFTFQFCKSCKCKGQHLRSFLSYFCPQLDLNIMNEQMTVGMERKFYKLLAHGDLRRLVNREACAFGDYIEKRWAARAQKRKQQA